MNSYTDEQIVEGLTKEDIAVTLKVLSHIDCRSAYGHNPECCAASKTLMRLLDKSEQLEDFHYNKDEAMKALVNHCRNSKKQIEEVLLGNSFS